MENEKNVFETIANEGHQEEPVTPTTSEPKKFDYNKLSDKPVGATKKYVRQSLHDKVVKIISAELEEATESDEVITTLNNKDSTYKKAKFILTYDTKNEDDVNDREYLSGIIQFIQKNGSLSDPKFYQAESENQVSNLWRLVAKKKNLEPNDLSPREFMGFLNSGIQRERPGNKMVELWFSNARSTRRVL